MSIWQAAVARKAKRRADAEATIARKAQQQAATDAAIARAVKEFLQNDLLEQAANEVQGREGFKPNPRLTVKEALSRASGRLGTRFRDQPLVEVEIRRTIGQALRAVGEFDPAIIHLDRALRLRQAHLGLDDPLTLNAMLDLAVVFREAGRYDEALTVHDRLLALTLASAPPLHELDSFLDQHGFTCYLAGRLDQADHLFRAAYQVASERGRSVENMVGHLAWNLLAQQKPEEAEPFAREALEIFERKEPGGWKCYAARSLLGGALMGQGKYGDAESLLLEGYEGLKRWQDKLDVPWSWRLKEALQRVVSFYEATDQPEKARAWRSRFPHEEVPPD